MRPVTTIEEIGWGLEKIKGLKKGLLTNFFLDAARTQLWLNLGLVRSAEIGETVFLFRRNQGFWNLFFISTSLESLEKDLDTLQSDNTNEVFVVDLLGKEEILSVRDTFFRLGFKEYTALFRMSRTADLPAGKDVPDERLVYADSEDAAAILSLFQEHFDPLCEQVPLQEEISAWIGQKQLIVYRGDKRGIGGFLIFEQTGKTSYLRYWFVHPDHREKGIGSKLIYRFFRESDSSKRQLFWVIGTNRNAIKRYEHYGFEKEPFYDYILINFDKKYEGENN